MSKSPRTIAHEKLMFDQRAVHLGHLPGHILLDLARNEAASREWRKAAVELLLEHDLPQASHPDLLALLIEVKSERTAKEDVVAVVESAIEAPLEPPKKLETPKIPNAPPSGPFVASVTTKSM